MKTINISIKEHKKDYPIIIGENLLSQLSELIDLTKYSKVAIIHDEHTQQFVSSIQSSLKQGSISIQIKSGEKEKHIETVKDIWQQFVDAKLDRKALVINVGGGVIGDMGGFAASTYMRGIAFLQIPTTLLSMVDASVGGKVGINFSDIKNVIGSFQQPIGVVIDTNTLQTLPDREFTSGFAEIIKHGLIDDSYYFETVTQKNPREFSQEELVKIIEDSCKIKAHIVQTDEHELGLRKILNFGHTIGHAIEILSAETSSPLLHGEAIAIGMIAEAKISAIQDMIKEKDVKIIEYAFIKAGLPIRLPSAVILNLIQDPMTIKSNFENKRDPDLHRDDVITRIMNKIQSDKKNSHGKIKWTLLSEIGKADYNIEVGEIFIKKAIDYIIQ